MGSIPYKLLRLWTLKLPPKLCRLNPKWTWFSKLPRMTLTSRSLSMRKTIPNLLDSYQWTAWALVVTLHKKIRNTIRLQSHCFLRICTRLIKFHKISRCHPQVHRAWTSKMTVKFNPHLTLPWTVINRHFLLIMIMDLNSLDVCSASACLTNQLVATTVWPSQDACWALTFLKTIVWL